MSKRNLLNSLLFGTVTVLTLTANAKFNCKSDDQQLVVDPSRKKIVLTKAGVPHKLKILNPANHGFQMFGNNSQAYEIEGGYVVGIKDTKVEKIKTLSIFKRGEVVASFEGCTEK